MGVDGAFAAALFSEGENMMMMVSVITEGAKVEDYAMVKVLFVVDIIRRVKSIDRVPRRVPAPFPIVFAIEFNTRNPIKGIVEKGNSRRGAVNVIINAPIDA